MFSSTSILRKDVPAWATDVQTYHFTLLGHTADIVKTMIQCDVVQESIDGPNGSSPIYIAQPVSAAIEQVYATLKKVSA